MSKRVSITCQLTEIQWFPYKGVYHEHFLTDFRSPEQRSEIVLRDSKN